MISSCWTSGLRAKAPHRGLHGKLIVLSRLGMFRTKEVV